MSRYSGWTISGYRQRGVPLPLFLILSCSDLVFISRNTESPILAPVAWSFLKISSSFPRCCQTLRCDLTYHLSLIFWAFPHRPQASSTSTYVKQALAVAFSLGFPSTWTLLSGSDHRVTFPAISSVVHSSQWKFPFFIWNSPSGWSNLLLSWKKI